MTTSRSRAVACQWLKTAMFNFDLSPKIFELRYIEVGRVKGGMSLRNGMRRGVRKDIIMRNLIDGKWRKEII